MTQKKQLNTNFQKYYLLLLFIFSNCQNNSNAGENTEIEVKKFTQIKTTSIKNIDTIQPNIPYTQTILNIKKEIQQTKKIIKEQKIDKEKAYQLKKKLFEKALVNQIFPYWYGTKWSFNGHTQIPNQGSISCGYFVSTTLSDVGVNVERISLAQQAPYNEALTLDIDSTMMKIDGNKDCETIIKNIKEKLEEGIYFIGFGGTHVGFLIQQKTDLYLAHTGSTSIITVIDKIENIPFFCLFYNYYIVSLSNNKSFLDKWWNHLPIKTVK